MHASFFFNSLIQYNSFGNVLARAFKTSFPPALRVVTHLYMFLDDAASAFLCDPENLH